MYFLRFTKTKYIEYSFSHRMRKENGGFAIEDHVFRIVIVLDIYV